MATTIIGIDCAVSAKRTGMALGVLGRKRVEVTEVHTGDSHDSVARVISNWIGEAKNPLIALDAPLGWPAELARVLSSHQAGALVDARANRMFRRLTDRLTKSQTGKLPLDVGADRIARTARATLVMLDELRGRTGEEIPLAWKPGPPRQASAIEVYPAATLKVCNIISSGYKRKGDIETRRRIIESLREHIALPEDDRPFLLSSDALDAAVCVLAGADFIRGHVIEPTEMDVAKREGWIWVREPGRLL
jgi:predicted RNase H-like nuclease